MDQRTPLSDDDEFDAALAAAYALPRAAAPDASPVCGDGRGRARKRIGGGQGCVELVVVR